MYALGLAVSGGPDEAIRARFTTAVTRLRQIDANGTGGAAYVATAYRGTLSELAGTVDAAVRAWPWTTIAPADFVTPPGGNATAQRTKVVTPAEVAAIRVPRYQDGIVGGLFLKAADGKTYSLVLRPLLPDETS